MHWLSFIYSVCCLPIFFESHFLPLCMTSVTLCELFFFLRFRIVFAIMLIWNWRRAIPWGNHVIPFRRSKPLCLCNPLREMVSAAWTQAHTHCVSIGSSTCSRQHRETHPANTPLTVCPSFQREVYVRVIVWFMQRNKRPKATPGPQTSYRPVSDSGLLSAQVLSSHSSCWLSKVMTLRDQGHHSSQ